MSNPSLSGWTPLHHAVCGGHEEITEFLLLRGADVTARTEARVTRIPTSRSPFCWGCRALRLLLLHLHTICPALHVYSSCVRIYSYSTFAHTLCRLFCNRKAGHPYTVQQTAPELI